MASNLQTTSFPDSGLTDGTTYYYKVTAVASGVESQRSAEVSATPQPPLPAAPNITNITAGDQQLTLTWNTVPGAVTYNVYRGTSSAGEAPLPIKTKVSGGTFTDTGLTDGTTYYYEVTAVNGGGEGGISNEVSASPVQMLPRDALDARRGQSATDAELDAGVVDADSYNLYRSTSSGQEGPNAIPDGPLRSELFHTGLTNGTTYYYQLIRGKRPGRRPALWGNEPPQRGPGATLLQRGGGGQRWLQPVNPGHQRLGSLGHRQLLRRVRSQGVGRKPDQQCEHRLCRRKERLLVRFLAHLNLDRRVA